MKTVYDERNEFGQGLKELRTNKGASLRDVDKATGINYSMISCIERGERAVGCETATRLADFLQLRGDTRDEFLLKAAGTRKRDRLLGYARSLSPELVNYVAKTLVDAGIDLATIDDCQFQNSNLLLQLRGGKQLTCTLSIAG